MIKRNQPQKKNHRLKNNKWMTKEKITLFIVLALTSFALFSYSRAVWVEKDFNKAKNIFSVKPNYFFIEAEPGDQLTRNFFITNQGSQKDNFSISKVSLKGNNKPSGENIFLIDTTRSGKMDWLVPEMEKFSLRPGETQHLNVKLKIPQNVEEGDYYFALLFKAETKEKVFPGTEHKNKVSNGVGLPFYLRVGEQDPPEISIKSFKTKEDFHYRRPITFSIQIENQADFWAMPSYNIKVYNFINRQVAAASPKKINVLKNSFRNIEIEWDYDKFLFGRYKAVLTAENGNQKDSREIFFWVVPWRELALASLFILLVILEIVFIKKRIKHKK